MKIIALPDLHGVLKQIPSISEQIASVDLVLLAGDLTSGGAANAERVVNGLREINPRILAVPGNWDDQPVDDYLTDQNLNLHGRHRIVDQIDFIGVGGALPFPIFPTSNELTEAQLESVLEQASDSLDPTLRLILVAHHPPYNTVCDLTSMKQHVGSHSVRRFIERIQPLICFTGHIHEGIGIDSIGLTRVVNPGPLWQGRYAYAEIHPDRDITLEIRSL